VNGGAEVSFQAANGRCEKKIDRNLLDRRTSHRLKNESSRTKENPVDLFQNARLASHAHLVHRSFTPSFSQGGPLDLKDIKTLIDLMKKNDLTELEIEKEGFKIALKRGLETVVPSATPQATLPAPVAAQPPAVAIAATPAPTQPPGKEIISPMVGTFYRSPSPESPAYVEVGQDVSEDTVVCIIEAMKVMNEIKAETRGVIAEVLVETGKPVQFGQPLFRVK
jgi:acetyl-CoA carboxylase biotin carboxyl carrier protein